MCTCWALVLEAPYYVVYAVRCQARWSFPTGNLRSPSTLVWYQTERHTYMQKHTHKYKLTPPVMCSQELSVLVHWC